MKKGNSNIKVQHFPTVTTARALARIRCERLLPRAGEITTRVGQKVAPVHVLGRCTQGRGFRILDASELLDVPPHEVSKYLVVEEGARLERGMPILRKPAFLGRDRRIGSPVDGMLHQVRAGNLILQQVPETYEMRAMMHGWVASIIPSRGVIVEADGALIQSAWDSGHIGYGTLRMTTATPDAVLTGSTLGADIRGSVVVCGRIERKEVLVHLIESGVRGAVVGSIPAHLALWLRGHSFPLHVTEGTGTLAMSAPIFELLQQSEGRETSLFPATEGARPRKPEIVIPLPTMHLIDQPADQGEPLEVGKRVRVVGVTGETLVGQVAKVYRRPRRPDAGTRPHGAEVKLVSGKVIFVPFSNLELII